MLSVSNVSGLGRTNNINFRAKAEKAEEVSDINELEREPLKDSLEVQHENGNYELTKEDKQAILKKARAKAAGWSSVGEGFSTLYYAFRSNKTIAKKFNLDVEKDKKLIKDIKRDQTLATLPGLFVPLIGGIAAYIYCKTQDPSDIDVD